MDPPDRHGLTTVLAPSTSGKSPAPSGRIRSRIASPDRSASTAAAATDVSTHWPPTNPSMVPSARTTAVSPARAEVGASARTTVASTKGSVGPAGSPARWRSDGSDRGDSTTLHRLPDA